MTRRRNLPNTERRTMDLPVPLTDAEIRGYGRKAAELDAELMSKKEALAAYQKAAKAEMDEIARERRELLSKVREEAEVREVDVEVEWVFGRNEVVTTRLDTGEIVRSRPMTFDERQERLFEPPEAVPIRETEDDDDPESDLEDAASSQDAGNSEATPPTD